MEINYNKGYFIALFNPIYSDMGLIPIAQLQPFAKRDGEDDKSNPKMDAIFLPPMLLSNIVLKHLCSYERPFNKILNSGY